jgi:hypothetical protein
VDSATIAREPEDVAMNGPGRAGDAVDRGLRKLAVARLRAHHRSRGSAVPAAALAGLEAGVELRFHGTTVHKRALDRYEQRRSEIAAQLAGQNR